MSYWWPTGSHDYKNDENLGTCKSMYDSFGNFMYGATGDAAGYSLDTLLIVGNLLHSGLNNGINSFDITSGYNSISGGGTLGTTNWNPPTASQ